MKNGKIQNPIIPRYGLKKLWENPNPTNRFTRQTITLLNDDYDYMIWIFGGYSSWNPQRIIDSKMVLKRMSVIGQYSASAQLTNGTAWKIANFTRRCEYIDDTHYDIPLTTLDTPNGDSYRDNDVSSGEWLIPLVIYGGKFN